MLKVAHLSRISLTALLGLAVTACATRPDVPWSTSLDGLDFQPRHENGVVDGRGRFREILCAVTEDHGEEWPDHMPCDDVLTRAGIEPSPSGHPVNLGFYPDNALILMVPGFGYQCIRNWLDHKSMLPELLDRFGYDLRMLEVEGLSSSDHNATMVRDYILNLPPEDQSRELVLIGYSKGAPDLLQAIVEYPKINRNIIAVISFAGAVGGSALAGTATQNQANLLTKVPKAECDEGDGGGVEALLPEVRKTWLEENELPDHIRYYSVVAFPHPDRMSSGLRSSFHTLGKIDDVRNDSQVVFTDQVIPGSTLIAFTNADHWAMAVPISRQHEFIAATFANQNNFPREIFFEAMMRFLEEDLSTDPVVGR